jgi:hypothetical protein
MTTTVVHDPAYDKIAGFYQPLNGDTQYIVTGQIGTDYAEQEYAFYASAGNQISVAAKVTATGLESFDGRLIVFDPTDTPHEPFEFINNMASVSFTAPASGMYLIRFENDYSSPSTVDYTLNISGADKPQIVIDSSADQAHPGVFYIADSKLVTNEHFPGGSPNMPVIHASLAGFIPDDLKGSVLNWTEQVQFIPADDPHALPNTATTLTIKKQVNGAPTVTFSQGDIPHRAPQGGRLSISVSTDLNGQTQTWSIAKTPAGQNALEIWGQNPSQSDIKQYVQMQPTPKLATGAKTYNFSKIVTSLIQHESSWKQFTDGFTVDHIPSTGYPTFSTGNDNGVGLMQITPLNKGVPSPADTWDWQQNITDGINLLSSKMANAKQHFLNLKNGYSASQLAALAKQYHLKSVSVADPTPDQLIISAVSLYGPTDKSVLAKNKASYFYWTYNSGVNNKPIVTRHANGTGTIDLVTLFRNPYVNIILAIYKSQ